MGPKSHPFEIRYTQVQKIDWESWRGILDAGKKLRVLSEGC